MDKNDILDLKRLAKTDPVKRNVEKGLEQVEHTPMEPPSAYEDPGKTEVDFAEMDEALLILIDEHKNLSAKTEEFEKALVQFHNNGYRLDDRINQTFREFFEVLDNELLPHNSKEEKTLFPVLHRRLIEVGEHSTGPVPRTAIDVMEDDHIKFIQLGALTFNLMGLAPRLRDQESRMFVFDTAFQNARELAELIKLHIYREDYILFPLAQKHLSPEELQKIELEMHDI